MAGNPVLAAKLHSALLAGRYEDVRRLLPMGHQMAYLRNAPFHAAVDVLGSLLPTMASRLDPAQLAALAALLPAMVEGMAAGAGAWYEAAEAEMARLQREGGPVNPPASPFGNLGDRGPGAF